MFGETAVERGFITREQLQTALAEAQRRPDPKPLGQLLVELGLMTAPQATAVEKLKGVLARGKRPVADVDAPPDESLDLTGKTLGGCLLLEQVGAGSMGTTWRAHHLRLDRDVVVKVLHPRLVAYPGNLERFAREARAAASLEHPAIVQIYDFDSDGGYHFIVMQWVDGQNLRQVTSARGAFGVRRALWVAARVLEGLAYSHGKGIVHRDIKPANLIITREPRIKIADFGLVRILSLSSGEKISTFGEIIGTPQYMAPEQATCDEVDGRTDLYSLGLTVYELMAGRPPFTGASTVEVLEKQIMEPLPDVRAACPDATSDIVDFLAKITAKDPAARFATADDALRALQALRTPGERGPGDRPMATTRFVQKAAIEAMDPSRQVESAPVVSEEALDELKRRLQKSQQFVAFELDGEQSGVTTAADAAEQATDRAARDRAIESSLGSVEVASSALRKARQRIDKAVVEGTAPKVVPELLHELIESGNLDDVLALEKDLDRALPTSAATSFFLGKAWEKKGQHEKARSRLALATVLAPDHLPARLYLARALVALDRVDEAVQTLQEANRWHPTSVQAATRLAEVLFVVKRDPKAAIPAYERAIELAPSKWQLRQQLALAFEELGRFAQAEAVLKEVVAWRQDKESGAAEALLAQVQKKRRKREALAAASGEGPDDSDVGADGPGPGTSARLSAIRLATAGNRWEKALKIAQEGLAEKPRSVPMLLAAAKAQVNLGKLADAVQSYGTALAVDPQNKEAQQGLLETQAARKAAAAKKSPRESGKVKPTPTPTPTPTPAPQAEESPGRSWMDQSRPAKSWLDKSDPGKPDTGKLGKPGGGEAAHDASGAAGG